MSDVATVRNTPSMWWGAMIICGTVVGAGMFTLPVVMAGAWFSWSALILVISWACMLLSGLMFQSASSHYSVHSGYDTITRDLLGNFFAEINGLSIVFVLGILTYAYISASGPVYQQSISAAGLPVSLTGAKILLTLAIALIVWIGTSGIGRLMSVLLVAKILLLLVLFGGLLTTVNMDFILDNSGDSNSYWIYTLGIIPFCLASFGYHGNISGLIAYYSGDHRRVRQALYIGTAVALVVYLFWIVSVMGNLPRTAFPELIKKGGDIAVLVQALSHHLQTGNLTFMLAVFSHFAVICSFLGVTAGLVDFISDRFRFAKNRTGRLKAVGITFLPPLAASIAIPDGFVAAIGYAGLFATLWAVIVPGLLFYKAKSKFIGSSGITLRDKLLFAAVMIFAVLNILSWLFSEMKLLPVFG